MRKFSSRIINTSLNFRAFSNAPLSNKDSITFKNKGKEKRLKYSEI